jgi:guanidinopropionase
MKTDQNEMQRPRYMGIPTFMRAPSVDDLSSIDIALIGVPFDGGVTNRPGARHGPREVRNQSSLMRSVHPETRKNPFDEKRIGDFGDVDFPSVFDLEASIESIHQFYLPIAAAGVIPLTVGGDHSISYPILKALGAEQPLGLIHIDSHTDTRDSFAGSKVTHGAPFRRAVEAKAIDPRRIIQIGIRGAQNATESWDYSREHGMRVIFMHEVDDLGIDGVIHEARRVVGDAPAYLSFDIDALDPVYAPGTGTPEAGGFTMREAIRLLRGLNGLKLAGGDLVEVSPPFDVGGLTALHGATVLYEMLCLMA